MAKSAFRAIILPYKHILRDAYYKAIRKFPTIFFYQHYLISIDEAVYVY